MLKALIVSTLFLVTAWGYSQQRMEQNFNSETKLIEATYFYDNGDISQEGTFNVDGQLHGKWTSYNENGEKIAVGSYASGKKTGTWYFWADNILKEVEFADNQIASVTEARNTSGIVSH
jgi:antitoxin component YwqK of YwqJK toxin-antitoxin module